MGKNLKKTLTLFAVSAALLGCGNAPKVDADGADILFWSADTIEKVVRDRGYDYYKNIARDPALNYRMGQGEYESAQLILTPNEDVSSYDVSVSDIVDSKGNKINNVKVYAQKYIKVSNIYDPATGESPGYFPDALLPFDAYKKYNENKITKGENQAIYVSLESSIDQAPGTYTGKINVTAGSIKKDFPISVTVLPVKISQTTHSNSIFLNQWNYQFQELDGSQHMMDKYTEACIDYRLGTDNIVINHNDEDLYLDYYVEKAYGYMQNPRYPTCVIPLKEVYSSELQQAFFDTELFKDYIRAYYDKSVETGFNMFSKTRVYIALCDEPEETERVPQAYNDFKAFNKALLEIADELDEMVSPSPIHSELIESIRNLKAICTNKYCEELAPVVSTWCPKADEYHRSYDRAKYDNQDERWWYTCVAPRAPYPTYHTEDTLTSARLLSWMQADYGVSGNLFWATNNYARLTAAGTFESLEDAYANADYSSNVNGDGYLFYPGGQYGIDGPVPSIRIEAIRDGLEEYELLYDLEQKANELGYSNEGLIDLLTYSLYNGTKIHGDNSRMRIARDELLDICEANSSGSNFLVLDYKNNNDGKAKMTFFAKNGSQIKVNGQALSPVASLKDGSTYETSINLNSSQNQVKIDIICNDKTTSFTHDFGGLVSKKASELKDGFSKYNASVSSSIVEGSSVIPSLDYDLVKLEIGKPKNLKQSIKYAPSFLSSLKEGVEGFSIEIINPTDTPFEFSVGGRFKKRSVDTYLAQNEMLLPGLNTVFVPLNRINWSGYGALDYLMFVFGNSDSLVEEAKTVYLGHFAFTVK